MMTRRLFTPKLQEWVAFSFRVKFRKEFRNISPIDKLCMRVYYECTSTDSTVNKRQMARLRRKDRCLRLIFLDYNDKRPIYEQIVEKFQHLILNGVLEADSKLPSVRALAVDLSINPNTIQKAYGELERQGYIYAVKGRGNFVKGTEDLLAREKKKVMEELESQIMRCRQVGVTHEEIREITASVYKEEP